MSCYLPTLPFGARISSTIPYDFAFSAVRKTAFLASRSTLLRGRPVCLASNSRNRARNCTIAEHAVGHVEQRGAVPLDDRRKGRAVAAVHEAQNQILIGTGRMCVTTGTSRVSSERYLPCLNSTGKPVAAMASL